MNELDRADEAQKVITKLLQYPHYKKMGAEGVHAIVHKAYSIGANPFDCLNGGMNFINGKVEMSAGMMNQLIRQAGHSITKAKESNNEICILHGKRKDNGDTWLESFSIEEAKQAGLVRNSTWSKYPRDMLFARALSRLARQLFPDVIKGCYVDGEISAEVLPSSTPPQIEALPPIPDPVEYLSKDQVKQILETCQDADFMEKLLSFFEVESLGEVEAQHFETILKWYAQTQKEENNV